jgi:peptide/nickel transport system substrate-binding protein
MLPRRVSRTLATIPALLGLSLAAACGGSSTSGATNSGGGNSKSNSTLTVAMASGITTLNPVQNGTGLPNQAFLQPAYDSLIIRTPSGALQPELATSWSYSDGNTKFHMNLRSGVKFSNGQAMTAQGVANWIMFFKKANGLFSARFADVSSVTVNGPLSLTMNLTQADAAWPSSFTQDRYGYVICPAGLTNQKMLGTQTCGAGPYVLDPAQTVSGTKYVYTPSKSYWNKSAVHWGKIVVEAITDPNAVIAAMSSGQVQVAVGSPQTASAAKGAGLSVTSAPELWDAVEIFDRGSNATPLGNVKVRQALEYAVNRAVVTKAVFGQYAQANTSMLVQGLPGYSASEGSQYTYNPAKAKSLLAQAGYSHGFSVTMVSFNRNGLENTLAQAIVPYLAAVGVTLKLAIEPASSAQLIPDLLAKKWPALMFFGQAEAPNLLTQEQLLPASGVLNPYKYNDTKLINMYNQYNSAPGTAAQESILEQMQTYIDDQAYYITLNVSDQVYYHTSGVTGVNVSSGEPILNMYTLAPTS